MTARNRDNENLKSVGPLKCNFLGKSIEEEHSESMELMTTGFDLLMLFSLVFPGILVIVSISQENDMGHEWLQKGASDAMVSQEIVAAEKPKKGKAEIKLFFGIA